MAQSTDQSIDAGLSGLAVRNAINTNLAALFSSSSGASAPSPTVGGMLWLDTSLATPVLKMRNNANTGWLAVVTSDYATATGLALIQAASATVARTAIAAPPVPTNNSAIPGYWLPRSSTASAALVLPAGGEWSWFVLSINGSGAVVSTGAGVNVGGATIAGATASVTHLGFCWRIA